jgi:rod shape-determining protein MreD
MGLLVALLIAIYPLNPAISVYRPEVLCLVVIYWVLHSPHQFGVGVAWFAGLLQDLVEDGVWGGHALALALVAYICLMSYQRLRSYSIGQQTFWIFVFVGIHQLFVNWIQGLDNYGGPARHMAISAMVSAACWPLLVICMRLVQRRYRIF